MYGPGQNPAVGVVVITTASIVQIRIDSIGYRIIVHRNKNIHVGGPVTVQAQRGPGGEPFQVAPETQGDAAAFHGCRVHAAPADFARRDEPFEMFRPVVRRDPASAW